MGVDSGRWIFSALKVFALVVLDGSHVCTGLRSVRLRFDPGPGCAAGSWGEGWALVGVFAGEEMAPSRRLTRDPDRGVTLLLSVAGAGVASLDGLGERSRATRLGGL